MRHIINYYSSFIAYVSKYFSLRILFIIFVSSLGFSLQANEDRFAPPSLNAPANDFNSRFTSGGNFNVDFLLSSVLNNARQIDRNVNKNKLFLTDQVNSNDGAISNSVIVPPGTDANTIIIINQNEGDSFAIQR